MRFGLGLGLQRNGAVSGGAPPTSPSSVLFDPTRSMEALMASALAYLSTQNWSIGGWIKNNDAVTTLRTALGDSTNTSYVATQPANASLRVRMNNVNMSSGTPANSLPLNAWRHFLLTFDPLAVTRFRVYLNGSQVLSSTQVAVAITFTRFGSRSASNFWSGNICEWAAWNKTLSAAEAAALVSAGAFVDPTTLSSAANLTNYWKFGVGDSAASILDRIGTNHLTPVNIANADFVSDHP